MERDPHADGPIEQTGVEPRDANAAVVLVHGRGARARGMLDLAREFGVDDNVTYLAPQAHRGTWYPRSFLEPIEANEPHLTSALTRLDDVVGDLVDEGISLERIVLLGFSQGGCLATEYAARNARPYGGVVAFSGGVIGPEGTPREYDGSMDATQVFLGCSDRDPHIPEKRVHETADVFDDLGCDVETRIYEGMGHGINEDEVAAVSELIDDAAVNG